MTSWRLTSPRVVAEIGKPPDIAQAHGVSYTGEEEVKSASPRVSDVVLVWQPTGRVVWVNTHRIRVRRVFLYTGSHDVRGRGLSGGRGVNWTKLHGCQNLAQKGSDWLRNETNPRLFHIRFQYIFARKMCWVWLGNVPNFGPNTDIRARLTTNCLDGSKVKSQKSKVKSQKPRTVQWFQSPGFVQYSGNLTWSHWRPNSDRNDDVNKTTMMCGKLARFLKTFDKNFINNKLKWNKASSILRGKSPPSEFTLEKIKPKNSLVYEVNFCKRDIILFSVKISF